MTRFLAACLLLCIAVAPSAAIDVCNSDLLFSYGVQNPQYLNQSSLFCQSGQTETCCSNNDQSWLLERWNEQNRNTIQPFYELTVWLFKTIFQFYEDVILSAKYTYINPKTNPECRQSAEFLILNYIDRDDLREFIVDLERSHDFYSDVRRGFFCSLCGVKNQKYFDTDLKKVIFSYDACQDLIDNVLETVATRVNKVMPILANMNALLNCQLPDEPDDQEIFTIKAEKFYAINRCYDATARLKSKEGLFSECRDFCSDFSLVEPSESFEGILRPLTTLKNKLLKTQIVPSDPLWDDVVYNEQYDFQAVKDVFFEADLSFQDLSKYEVIFESYGLDPTKDAETSMFSYSEESGMEHLKLGANVLRVVLVGVLAWMFK